MNLPKIIQDEITYNQQLIDLIHQRYLASQTYKLNFESGQISAINAIAKNKQATQQIQKLLEEFVNLKIQNGYCYYKLKSLQNCEEGNIKQNILSQLGALSQKKSDYHKINHLIMMREVLLSKLSNSSELSKQMWQWIDDIRFMNEQIIKAVRMWRQILKEKGVKEVIIYLYKQENYLTKMIVDNHKVLENFNYKQPHFVKIPNPFFIPIGKFDQNLSIKSINQFLQYLSQEKALELKMIIESPFAKVSKNSALQNELVLMRNGLQDQKIDKIKTIYQSQKEQIKSTRNNIFTFNQQKIDLITMKNQSSIKNLEKLIKIKEIQVLKEMNKKKNIFTPNKHQSVSIKDLKAQPYLSKLQNLKADVQRNTKINAKKPLPKAQHQIKSSKPKIKLFSQKEIQTKSIQKLAKQTITNDSGINLLSRSKSTFYKQSNEQQQKLKSNMERQKRRSEQINMISSTYSSASSLKIKTSINIRKRARNLSSKKEQVQKSKSRQQELNQVKDSLALLNRRIRQQAIKNIYSNKNKKSVNQISAQRIKRSAQHQSQAKSKQLQLYQSPASLLSSFQDKIKNKENRIDQLKKKLSQIKAKNNEQLQSIQDNTQSSFKQQSKTQKQRLQLQNIKLKEQMKKQQLKFLALKEKEYELRQAEMQKKYKHQLQKIKEQLQLKNKQWELRIVQQQKKHKQSVSKIEQMRKKSELIALELQQKEIKERLLAQISQQQEMKKQKNHQQDKAEKILQAIKRQQQKYKLELQRKSLQNFQEEKLKLNELYMQMKRKNQALYQQNMKRHHQLQKIQKEKLKQMQALQNLQSQIIEKQKEIQLQRFLEKDQFKKQQLPASVDQIQRQIINEQYQLQELKQRIKMELMEQIKKKRNQEEQEQKQYQIQRKKHIAEMQEELRRVMKLQEQGLLKIQQQYKLKNQQIIKQHQQQLINSRLQKEKIKEESEQTLKRLQHSQPFQVQTLVAIDTGLQKENDLKRSISSESISQIKRQKSEFFIDQKKNEASFKQEQQPISNKIQVEEKPKQAQAETIVIQNKAPLQEQKSKIENQQQKQTTKQILPQKLQANTQQQSPSKLLAEQQKVTQTVKQNSQQIKQKYDILLSKVSKPTKQIFMSFDQIDSYLNKFYGQLPQEVKQMIPYSRKQVESIFREKKVDVFDGFSFGLYRPKERKFTLFGAIQCIPLVASKYGQIQVQQVYLFNKNNGYQKQYLSKQIKLYQKIGYIYQKKTAEQGMYTIKFIVKIPKDGKKQINLKDQLQIKAILHFEQHTNNEVDLIKNHCIYYILCRGLSENLTQKQKSELALQNNIESKYINKKLNDPLFSNNVIKTEIINHNIVQMTVNLPIKYIQTIDQPFFTLQVVQYVIKATEEKIFLALFQENGIAIVIHQMSHIDVPEGFSLQKFIESKFKRMQKVSQMFLFLPVWQSSKKYYYKGNSPKPFSYIQKTHASLVYGSIVKSKVHKGDFMFLQPPFAFLIFEITSAQVLKRMLFGHIVKPQEVLRMKRMIN